MKKDSMTFSTINPATEQPISEYHIMPESEALSIAKSTALAFQQWKELPLQKRLQFVKKLALVLRKNKQKYAELMTKEMGKVITQSLAEVEKCASLCDTLVEKAEVWLKEEEITADGKQHLITFEPLGTILIIMPWNYPFWQVIKVGLPPLVAGNAILLKHARNVTGSSLAIEQAFLEAGFPKDIFRSLIIDHDTTSALIASDVVQAVSLTGSVGAGSKIAAEAGKHIKKTVLELGGSDPFIVLDDADVEKAALGATHGRISNTGQMCIGAKRFIVHKKVADRFSQLFAKNMAKLKMGDPLKPETEIGPLVNKQAVMDMEYFVQDAIQKGATIAAGGKRREPGCYFEPTVITNTKPTMKVITEETFGPLAPVIIVNSDDEAIDIANISEFGLNASIWTNDVKRGEKIARKINVGGVFVNSTSKSHPLLPLGGIKKSGYGRELSHYGIKEFVNIKPINIYNP